MSLNEIMQAKMRGFDDALIAMQAKMRGFDDALIAMHAKMRGFDDALIAMHEAASMDAPKWIPGGSMTAFPEGPEIYQRMIER